MLSKRRREWCCMTFTCSCFSVLLLLRAAIFGVFGMTDGREKSIRRSTVTNFLWWNRFYGPSPRSYTGPGCAVMAMAPSSECLRRVYCRGYVTSFDDVWCVPVPCPWSGNQDQYFYLRSFSNSSHSVALLSVFFSFLVSPLPLTLYRISVPFTLQA